MKRQLNDEEKKFTCNNLKLLKDELEYLEKVELARKQLAVDTAEIVVKKQISDLKIEIKVLLSKINELKMIIENTEKILIEGVEMDLKKVKKIK